MLFNLEGTVKSGYGGLAQLGERLPCKQEVSGSIPLISTMYLKKIPYGGLAQLGERLPCKQEVTGSHPVLSTIGSAIRANSSAG